MSGMPSKIPDDKFTAEWYRVRFEGLGHSMCKLSFENMNIEKRIEKMWQRIDELEKEAKEYKAKIGELIELHQHHVSSTEKTILDLTAKITKLEERHERLGKHVTENLPKPKAKTEKPNEPTKQG